MQMLHLSPKDGFAHGLCYKGSGPCNFCQNMTIKAVEGLSRDLFLYLAYLVGHTRLFQNWNSFGNSPTNFNTCQPNYRRIFLSILCFILLFYFAGISRPNANCVRGGIVPSESFIISVLWGHASDNVHRGARQPALPLSHHTCDGLVVKPAV